MDNRLSDAWIEAASRNRRRARAHLLDFPARLHFDPADAAPGIPPWSSPYRLWHGVIEETSPTALKHEPVLPDADKPGAPVLEPAPQEAKQEALGQEAAGETGLEADPDPLQDRDPLPAESIEAGRPSAPWMPPAADLAWIPEPVAPVALVPASVIAEPIGTSWPFAPTVPALMLPRPDMARFDASYEAVPKSFQQPPIVTLRTAETGLEPAILSADTFAKILMGDVSAPPTLDAEPVGLPPPQRYEPVAPAGDFEPPLPGRPEKTSRTFVKGAHASAADAAQLSYAIDARGRARAGRDGQGRWGRRTVFGVLVLGLPLAGAAFMLLPDQIFRPPADTAIFTAPTLVLRAAVAGRVTAVQATDGASLQPDTPLLTIHAEPPQDPAAAALRSRLAAAETRVETLDSQLAQPAGVSDAAKARTADLRRLRLAATAERDQLTQAVAATPAREASDLVLRARVRGFVRTVEVAVGTETVPGSPLIQLIDCDRAFMVARDGPLKLAAGDQVQVQIEGLPRFSGRVRPSAGVSEPPGSLVIEPVGLNAASAAACPLGAQALVTSEAKGS